MLFFKSVLVVLAFFELGPVAARNETCGKGSCPVMLAKEHQMLQLGTKVASTATARRLHAFSSNSMNVATVIQCGIHAILTATMHFSVEPPRVLEGITELGSELLGCIEKIIQPEQHVVDGYGEFKVAWDRSFETIASTAESVQYDIEVYHRDGYEPALIRAIGTIIGDAGTIVTNFLPSEIGDEVGKYLHAITETFDTMGTSWDEFKKGNTVEGIEAIYWGLRSITDSVMPDVLKDNEVYNTIIGTLDVILGNLSTTVLEYERLIMESNTCWRTEKSRHRERPDVCPSDKYWADGSGWCHSLEGHGKLPGRCPEHVPEKHWDYCYSPCNNGWEVKGDNMHKCISACEGKFPAETPQMCGRDSGIITKAILEMVTVVLNSAFTLADNIITMQSHGVNAEVLVSTIQVFIDMGKPFAKPICPEGVPPTPAPNPAACSKPCDMGVPPGLCRIETGGFVICLPSANNQCSDGQMFCPLTPAPTPALPTPPPTPEPTVWANGGRRRTPAPPPTAAPTPTTTTTPPPQAAPTTPPPQAYHYTYYYYDYGYDYAHTSATTTTTPPSQVIQEVGCDEASWPDVDNGLICGKCKVLVNRFRSHYKTCDGYCASLGRKCTGAWEEEDETCEAKYVMSCDQTLQSSDAICECLTKP